MTGPVVGCGDDWAGGRQRRLQELLHRGLPCSPGVLVKGQEDLVVRAERLPLDVLEPPPRTGLLWGIHLPELLGADLDDALRKPLDQVIHEAEKSALRPV